MFNFVKLPLFLFFYVLNLGTGWKVVSKTHSETISNHSRYAEAQNDTCTGFWCHTTQYDDESVDGAIKAPVN